MLATSFARYLHITYGGGCASRDTRVMAKRRRRHARASEGDGLVWLAVLLIGAGLFVSFARYILIGAGVAGFTVVVFYGFKGWAAIRRWRQPPPPASAIVEGDRRADAYRAPQALSGPEFERTVAQLLRDHAFLDVKLVGGPNDLGVDITCRDLEGRFVIVQCKRYQVGHRVRSKVMQNFVGMGGVHHYAERMVFVTTSWFTDPAYQLGRHHRVEMIGGF